MWYRVFDVLAKKGGGEELELRDLPIISCMVGEMPDEWLKVSGYLLCRPYQGGWQDIPANITVNLIFACAFTTVWPIYSSLSLPALAYLFPELDVQADDIKNNVYSRV